MNRKTWQVSLNLYTQGTSKVGFLDASKEIGPQMAEKLQMLKVSAQLAKEPLFHLPTESYIWPKPELARFHFAAQPFLF